MDQEDGNAQSHGNSCGYFVLPTRGSCRNWLPSDAISTLQPKPMEREKSLDHFGTLECYLSCDAYIALEV